MLFSGNAHPALAQDIAQYLHLPLGQLKVGRFSDGEIQTEVMENVRGRDVFVVQPTCQPTNDNIMELMMIIDALRRSSAGRITAVIPYFGYARQDRRLRSAARADLGQGGGADDLGGRRQPRADGRPARRADPGLLRVLGRQRLCQPAAARRHLPAELRKPDRRLARRRWRGARPRAGQAPRRRRPGDHRQAPPTAQRSPGHAHHRRRAGARPAS